MTDSTDTKLLTECTIVGLAHTCQTESFIAWARSQTQTTIQV